jgi:hypothetical protein
MGHTQPPLKIGFRNGQGYVSHERFDREKGEVVEVRVETPCSVRFDRVSLRFFKNQDYSGPQDDTWVPINTTEDITCKYDVIEYQPLHIERAHTIKIGSG